MGEQSCFRNTGRASAIMETFLHFPLAFPFPTPDPGVCGAIYSVPFRASQEGRISFCSRWNKSPNLLLFKLSSAYRGAKCKTLRTRRGLLTEGYKYGGICRDL